MYNVQRQQNIIVFYIYIPLYKDYNTKTITKVYFIHFFLQLDAAFLKYGFLSNTGW